MAVFGLPGGAEWAIIALVVVFLFVPGALVFWLGFLTGKGAAARHTADAPTDPAGSVTPAVQQAPSTAVQPAAPPPSASRETIEAHEVPPEKAASAERDSDVTLTWDTRGERDDG